MHGLGMLPKVIEAGESSRAVALKWALAGVFSNPRAWSVSMDGIQRVKFRNNATSGILGVPDMPCEMLAPGEAQVARRIVGAVEPLGLLLLIRPRLIGVDALVVRPGTVLARASIRLVHVHVVRILRLSGVLGVRSPRRLRLLGSLRDLDRVRKWRGRQRLL